MRWKNKNKTNVGGCENIWLKLHGYQRSKKSMYIGLFYLPPNTPVLAYRAISEGIIRLVSEGASVLIMGDFNVPSFYYWYCKIMNVNGDNTVDEVVTEKRSSELIDLIHVAGLRSFNNVLNYRNKTLDLVLSNIFTVSVAKGDSFTTCVDMYQLSY
jgi:hypothetical protein